MRSKSLIFIVGGVVAAAIAAALIYWFAFLPQRAAAPAAVVSAPASPAAAPSAAPSLKPTVAAAPAATPAAAPKPAMSTAPSFDVVRVEPSGEAVIAGRAAPTAKVELSDDGKPIGDAAADFGGRIRHPAVAVCARPASAALVGQARPGRAAAV